MGNLFEKNNERKFPNLVKEIDMQIQEAQSPKQDGCKRPPPRHFLIKMLKVKDKERILKAARENKLVTHRGVTIRLLADFSKETLQARRDWQKIFKVMKAATYKPRLPYPTKISFRIEGQIKSFPDKRH